MRNVERKIDDERTSVKKKQNQVGDVNQDLFQIFAKLQETSVEYDRLKCAS